MEEKMTPLMRQYSQIKQKYPDTILLFRMGDFFETFDDDAVITSQVCGITLTKRHNGAAQESPLAGFPFHQLDAYLPKIVRAGYRVAVCEQLEDPAKARGIVKRGVIEVVTPGVALYEKLLDTKKNNYVAAIVLKTDKYGVLNAGLAAADISTGEFFTGEFPASQLIEILESLAPAEIIINKAQKNEVEEELHALSFKPSFTKLEEWIFEEQFARDTLLRHFKTQNLKGFGIENYNIGLSSAGAVLYYISETQQGHLPQIKGISIYDPSEYMTLDYATRRNLEILVSFSDTNSGGTLISILDKTCTAMGGRLFKKWITRPLKKLETIHKRLKAVRAFFDNDEDRYSLRKNLDGIGDLERLISRVCTGRANPRDVISLKNSLKKIPEIKQILFNLKSDSLASVANKLKDLPELIELIDSALIEEPSTNVGSGNVFRQNYSQELDTYVKAKLYGKNWISEYQEKEREATGIPSLKVGYTSVFGYYIEVTRTHTSKVPNNYHRKQTLTNAERYTTSELKEIETKILSAEENISQLEQSLFTELRNKIAEYTMDIQSDASLIAAIDCLQSYSQASREYNYCEPQIDDSEKIEIKNGRHPVVERLLPVGDSFTPNSTNLDTEKEQIHIITGPNMAGKSCYLRQTALIVLLGQIGCFVPAESAQFGLVDRIFTRVGAQDNITAGESTFLVEMQEAANIMNNATRKSLILLDEVGRGTATFDGISIAWSISEYIHNHIGAKTLFATHYHELNELAERYERIKNYRVEVIEAGSTVIFSHKVQPGSSDHSFGIYVAKMAGLPLEVVERSQEIMHALEKIGKTESEEFSVAKANLGAIETLEQKGDSEQMAIFEFRDDQLRERILNLKIDMLTPIQAIQVLSDMQKEAKRGKKK